MLENFDFGVIQTYVDDPLITDINYNGRQCWIDHLRKGRYPLAPFDAHEAMQILVYKIANYVNLPFNATSPVLEAETESLRISLLHPSIAKGGLSLSLRKTPAVCRLHDAETGIKAYAPEWVIVLLQEAVKHRKNILVSGLPGSGKTEFVKYLMESIPAHERVITIEDSLELRYGDIHPTKDHVMLKVQERFGYEQAIKTSLRQRPDWICVSEVRGSEIMYLLQSISTGTSLISTIHAESAFAIPARMLMLMPGFDLNNQSLLTMIHDCIDFGIHLEVSHDGQKVVRSIRELVQFKINENYEQEKKTIYQCDDKNKTIRYSSLFPSKKTKVPRTSLDLQ